jgi:hypothetical protein
MAVGRQMQWGRAVIGFRAERLSAFIFPVTPTRDIALSESMYLLLRGAATDRATMEDNFCCQVCDKLNT